MMKIRWKKDTHQNECRRSAALVPPTNRKKVALVSVWRLHSRHSHRVADAVGPIAVGRSDCNHSEQHRGDAGQAKDSSS